MKRLLLLITAILTLGWVTLSWAGVVITQQTVTDAINGHHTSQRTLMIQGKMQKTVMNRQVILINLTNNTMTLLDPDHKTYLQMPFPPKRMAAAMQSVNGMAPNLKKTGVSKTIAGYRCYEYKGAGSSAMGEYTVSGCFAPKAPGASEYDAFSRALSRRLRASSVATMSHPDGIPLTMVTTTKITNFSMLGLNPQQAQAMAQQMAGRPPAKSTMITTAIDMRDLPASTFEIPSDYTKTSMPPMSGSRMGGPLMMAPPRGPAAAPTPYRGE
ncbi:MAG TPA: DUF4412 domain-containing protein [Candidatus Binataceae bacterium]|nr:DUF4412 domain-containing protein [Candidatus Binataceae bacterium]